MKNKDLQHLLQQYPDDMEVLLPIHDGADLRDELETYTCTVAKVSHKKSREISYHFSKDEYWFVCNNKKTLKDLGEVTEETIIIID
jgi:hypothetical protein